MLGPVFFFSAYGLNIIFKHSQEHGNAKGLSRLPLPSGQSMVVDDRVIIFNVGHIQALPFTFQDIKLVTKHDPTLSNTIDYKDGMNKGSSK